MARVRRVRRKLDLVREACKTYGVNAMTFFKRAYRFCFGDYNEDEVRRAHSAYKNNRHIEPWVQRFSNHLLATGAKTLFA